MLRRGQEHTKRQAKDHNKEPKATSTAKLNKRKKQRCRTK
jgi:hypothetical protein